MKRLAIALLAAAALGAAPAMAQGWYVGVGGGQAKADLSGGGVPGATVDDKDTAFTLRLGARLNPNVAVELGYFDLGEYGVSFADGATVIRANARAKSIGISLVAMAQMERLDIYGRVGYARSELEASGGGSAPGVVILAPDVKESENEAFAGVGLRWNATRNLGLFAEYQRHEKLEVDAWFVGIDFRY